ncbi:MAG: glutamate-5-semialdehyde dehydrogenase [Xanthomonadales bacterium]|nr:glutamate-5-semialdehyde dehydrogenase [Xanthomonadales bacterium]
MNSVTKNQTLSSLAQLITQNRAQILAANQRDLAGCAAMDPSLSDRLKVDSAKVDAMLAAIEKVILLEDPEGRVLYQHQREDGLLIENRSVPFGTILIIYESRPDVTIEAAVTAFKAGNQILLKGGKESLHTNLVLVGLWHQALADNGVDTSFVQYLQMDRSQTQALICDNTHNIDLIIPRGGEKLIEFVQKNTSVPALISGRGNNFLYIDKTCDFAMASRVAVDGKQRLSVCNALDKILLHLDLPNLPEKLHELVQQLTDLGLSVFGDKEVCALNRNVLAMPSDEMWSEEFLSEKILIGLVVNSSRAINMINQFSGGHSAVIVSDNRALAVDFQQQVDCAAVYHNASSRFTDGGEFGLGAEIAISTQKLHFRGPVGLGELVTNKWFIDGQGQIRE